MKKTRTSERLYIKYVGLENLRVLSCKKKLKICNAICWEAFWKGAGWIIQVYLIHLGYVGTAKFYELQNQVI
jgi:hypothetical protein